MIKWRIVSPEEQADREAHRCRARRGKRSKIECETDTRNHPNFHAGRNDFGWWYFWEVTDERDLGTSHRQDEPPVHPATPT